MRANRNILMVVLAMAGVGSSASAEIWTAKCHNLEFRFDRASHRATVSMQAVGGAVFEIASGAIGLDNGTALRATVSAPPQADDDKVNEVGINKSRNIVYLVRHLASGNDVKDGVFCETPVTVVP